MRCPVCGVDSGLEAMFCPRCGADLRPVSMVAPAVKKKDNTLPIVVAVVLTVVITVAGVFAWLAWAYNDLGDLEEKTGILTVTVVNPNYFTDTEYIILLDGESAEDATLPANTQVTHSYQYNWLGEQTVNVSVIWAGGSQSESVTLVADSVVGVSFTL